MVTDIKPGSCPNPLNVKSKGVLPVAIVGTEDFDVTTVDPETVELEGVAAHEWEIKDATNPPADDELCFEAIDEDGDGIPDNIDEYDDLVLYFYTQAVVEALGDVEDGKELTLTLTGNLTSDTPIEGEDLVIIIAKGMLAPSKPNTLSTLWGEIKAE